MAKVLRIATHAQENFLSMNVTKPISYLRIPFASFNRIRLILSPDHNQKNMFAFIFFIITNYNKPLVADKRILQLAQSNKVK